MIFLPTAFKKIGMPSSSSIDIYALGKNTHRKQKLIAILILKVLGPFFH